MSANSNNHDIQNSNRDNGDTRRGLLFRIIGASPFRTTFSVFTMCITLILAFIYAAADNDEFVFYLPQPVVAARGNGLLLIDGNNNDNAVEFDHTRHFNRYDGSNCAICHHLLSPGGNGYSCAGCHRDMHRSTAMFQHEKHLHVKSARRPCNLCHAGLSAKNNTVACVKCHTDFNNRPEYYRHVRGYADALHGLCSQCHREVLRKASAELRCQLCHKQSVMGDE